MAYERTRAAQGEEGRGRRYPARDADEEWQPPDEYESPHTISDDSGRSWRDWVGRNQGFVIVMSIFALAGLAIVLVYFGRYFATTLSNPWVQRIAAALVIVGVGYQFGRSSERGRLEQRDILVLYDPDREEIVRFLGEWTDAQAGHHPVFKPYKGFSMRGHSAEPYEIGELSEQLADARGHDPEDPVRIRIHPEEGGSVATDTGRLTVQWTAGLEPDAYGKESNVVATLPDVAAENTVSDLKTAVSKLHEERKELEEELDAVKRQRDNLLEQARKTREEIREDMQKDLDVVAPLLRRPDRRSTNGHRSDGDGEGLSTFERMDREFASDE
jgi:hypothetical protein